MLKFRDPAILAFRLVVHSITTVFPADAVVLPFSVIVKTSSPFSVTETMEDAGLCGVPEATFKVHVVAALLVEEKRPPDDETMILSADDSAVVAVNRIIKALGCAPIWPKSTPAPSHDTPVEALIKFELTKMAVGFWIDATTIRFVVLDVTVKFSNTAMPLVAVTTL
jgi:hypothetical protein